MNKKIISNSNIKNLNQISMQKFVSFLTQNPTDTLIQMNKLLHLEGPNFKFQPYEDEIIKALEKISLFDTLSGTDPLKLMKDELEERGKRLLEEQAPFTDTYIWFQELTELFCRNQDLDYADDDYKEDTHVPFYLIDNYYIDITTEPFRARLSKDIPPLYFMHIFTSEPLSDKDILRLGGIQLQGFVTERMAFDETIKEEFNTKLFADHDESHARLIWHSLEQEYFKRIKSNLTANKKVLLRQILVESESMNKAAEEHGNKIIDPNTKLAYELLHFHLSHEDFGPHVWTKNNISKVLTTTKQGSYEITKLKERAKPEFPFAYDPKYKTQAVYNKLDEAIAMLKGFVDNYKE